MRNKILIIFAIIILLAALAVGYSFLNERNFYPAATQNQNGAGNNTTPAAPSESSSGKNNSPAANPPSTETPPAIVPSTPAAGEATIDTLTPPLTDALSRVTKKPFGIKISPATSPVQPEKFSGYHTGVDFEILPGEEDKDVPVYAVCTGTVVYKNYVSGYGGVFIEQCKLDGQEVTVLYGHLKLASITNKLNDNIKAGDQIAILGKGYSQETDGERKHLHLGIHKGTAINFKGYVQTQAELSGWLDAMKYLNS